MAPSSSHSKVRTHPKGLPSSPRRNTRPVESMGLLSQTLAPSPNIRWILPARIRSRQHNDIVFVGNTHVQLRESLATGQLADATAKLDLQTQILGAKVISAKVERVPVLDAVLEQEVDEERYIIKGQPCSNHQPPQIVVLITASCELIYLYAKPLRGTNLAEFVFAKRALLEGVSMPGKFNRHIAVDPECKILAVASSDVCTVFSLKEVDDLQVAIDQWDPRSPQSFQPNLEQRLMQVDGYILRMDFLRATEEQPEKAILVLIVAKKGQTHLLLYQWDTRDSLIDMAPMRSSGQVLLDEDAFPSLLIPSSRRASFALVTEDQIVFYDNATSRQMQRFPTSLKTGEKVDTRRLWVQWAKLLRHKVHSDQNEDILLVREDGLMMVLLRPYQRSEMPFTLFSPGYLTTRVDSALCVLPGPRGIGGDTVVVGGDMNDGIVLHLPARKHPEELQRLQNVSPIHDMALVDAAVTRQLDTRTSRTFVTAGMLGSSTLAELRFGFEAQVGWDFLYPEGAIANRVWVMEHVSSKRIFILISHPEHTRMIAIETAPPQIDSMESEQMPGFQFNKTTLAAEILSSALCVQITVDSIRVGFDTASPKVLPIDQCICAHIDGGNGAFAVACQKWTGYHIKVGMISGLSDDSVIQLSPADYQSAERPLCLELFSVASKVFLTVGYQDGHVDVFAIDDEGRPLLINSLSLSRSDITAITSIVAIIHDNTRQALILAGSRDGSLYVVQFEDALMDAGTELRLERTYRLGSTSVSIVHDESARSENVMCAIAECGSRLDRITSFRNEAQADFMLSNIWLTTRNNMTYTPPNITTIQTIRPLKTRSVEFPSNHLLCCTADSLLFATLMPQEQMVPRRLDLGKRGARLMVFSQILRKFVVASDSFVDDDLPSDSREISEGYTTLHVVDPFGPTKGPDDGMVSRVVVGDKHEQIKALITWEPTDGSRHFDLIMVGLSDSVNSRLGFVGVKKLANPSKKASFKSLMRFTNKSLHALCPLEKSSLAVSVGREIVIMRLDVTTKKWYEEARFSLPSPALSISAQGSVIYAATASHSTIALKWDRTARRFEKLMTDRIARNAKVVVPFGRLGDHMLVATASDRGSSLLSYSIMGNPTDISTPLFEAELPVGLNRLVPVHSSWSHSSQQAFQGTSIDGTVYIFKTLTQQELRLLRFVENLVVPHSGGLTRKAVSLLGDRASRGYARARREENMAFFDPKSMHIHGDVLKRLVDAGPSHLRDLLKPSIKNEDSMVIDDNTTTTTSLTNLESLARPFVGKTDDVPAAVVAWLRKLLRSTIF